MPRCCQFSEDRKEPSAGRSRSATDKLGDTARPKWRTQGRELFGAPLGIAPQLQPLQGMLLRRSTDIHPKELARDMRQFFNSLQDSESLDFIQINYSVGEREAERRLSGPVRSTVQHGHNCSNSSSQTRNYLCNPS